jgi:hypothetical protein
MRPFDLTKRDRDERPEARAVSSHDRRFDPPQAKSPPKVVFVPLVGAIRADA